MAYPAFVQSVRANVDELFRKGWESGYRVITVPGNEVDANDINATQRLMIAVAYYCDKIVAADNRDPADGHRWLDGIWERYGYDVGQWGAQ